MKGLPSSRRIVQPFVENRQKSSSKDKNHIFIFCRYLLGSISESSDHVPGSGSLKPENFEQMKSYEPNPN
jgi:hypothetical protein